MTIDKKLLGLVDFINDGMLIECSWLPKSIEDFNNYLKNMRILNFEGGVIIYSGSKNLTYIDTIYVKKAYRHLGIATKILMEFSANKRVALICSDQKLNFYKRLGYIEPTKYNILIKDNR